MIEDDEDATGIDEFLNGRMLIAMPTMPDPRFRRAVVYLCAHSSEGAMGLIVNRRADSLTMGDLFRKLSIPLPEDAEGEPIRFGGPVETQRGFVLHSADYHLEEASLRVEPRVSMTATLEVLHAIGRGEGPAKRFVALGYAGWGPGQLESEIRGNGWLVCPPDPTILFDLDDDAKWQAALSTLGVSAALLSGGGSA